MTDEALARRVLDALVGSGLQEAEVYMKTGRSRRVEIGPQGRIASSSQEEGWAVRAGSDRASFFAAGTGRPSEEGLWPDPDGLPLRLPPAVPVPAWKPPGDLDAPLAVLQLTVLWRNLSVTEICPSRNLVCS